MSYLVLARKWRPLSFDDLVGQPSVVRTLRNALEQGRVAHAYVFSGPRGVGKTTTARILSRALNCESGPTPSPCGSCAACRAITEGSAVDVIEIDGASNRGINEIRELREGVRYAPASGKYKVYIIDEVHMLTKEAFNALLKTLEEPPAHVVFIFATTSPKSMPVTVLSRCQHLAFRRIAKAQIMEHLAYIAGQEKIEITPGALEMIARVGEGSLRDSLTVLDQATAFSDRIGEEELQAMLGLPERGVLYELAGGLVRGDRPGLLALVADLADGGTDLRAFPKELAALLRNLLVVKAARDPATLLELPEDEILDLEALARQVEIEELTLMLNEFLDLETEIRASGSPRYRLELSLVRASLFRGSTSIDTLIERLERIDPELAAPAGAAAAEPPEKKSPPERPGGALSAAEAPESPGGDAYGSPGKAGTPRPRAGVPSDPDTIWRELLRRVRRENHPLSEKLKAGRLTAVRPDALEITFQVPGAGFYVDSLQRSLETVERVVSEILGAPRRVRLLAAENPVRRETGDAFRRKVLEEPLVRSAIELFEAKVVEVRPLDAEFGNGGDDVEEDAG